ncbi:MAG: nickel insertion protein, partial [Verrucomicrobiota bacterium]|nr:nickel insertion protein [Verrucomicrobiota bacterium]MEC7236070.1 nickel insertion protein [Verrucomicrobiota bacterium]
FKKGRLGTVVHCLCKATDLERIESTIFKHSLSIGIRRQLWERTKLERENVILKTEFGTVRAKVSTLPDGSVYRKFEYEDCARIARKMNKSIDEITALLNASH